MVPLGALLEPIEQVDPRSWGSQEFNYIDIASIDNELKQVSGFQRIQGKDAPSRARKMVESGDVIVSTVRPNLNAVAMVPSALNGEVCSTGFAVLRAGRKLLPKYLFGFVRSKIFIDTLVGLTKGANYPAVSERDVRQVHIPLPPLAEQERIVAMLDEADAIRKLRAQADQRTADLIPALFIKMFGDPATNPMGWPEGTLRSFGATVRYGLGQPPPQDPNGLPIIRATNIKRGTIVAEGLIRVRREDVPPSRNAFLNEEDVLVVRSGAYTGDVALVGQAWRGSVAGYDLVVSPGSSILGHFLAWYALSDRIQNGYFKSLRDRAAQPHLNATQVANMPLILPPLELQEAFSALVQSVDRSQAWRQTMGIKCQKLLDSIFARQFADLRMED
jgi:type I restriction enzyme S subunit